VASFAEVFESCSGLMILCAILSAAVWYFARYLDLYSSDDSVDFELKELRGIWDPNITSKEATPAATRRNFVPLASQGGGNVMVPRANDWTAAPEEVELTFNVMDISDHLEDSMDESPRDKRQSGVVY
jgi:hypothetical protein